MVLSQAKLPPSVAISTGPLGAVLKISFWTQRDWVELLFARLDDAQGLRFGLLPDRPLTVKQLRAEWASAVRTRKVAVPLTRPPPTVTVGGSPEKWSLDDFY